MVTEPACIPLTDRSTSILFVVFQVKRLSPGTSEEAEHCITVSVPPPNPPVISQTEVHHDQHQGQLPLQTHAASQLHLRPQPMHFHSQFHHQQLHAGPNSRAGEPAVVHSHRGSSLHLSAVSACSSSSMPGRVLMFKPQTMPQWEEKCNQHWDENNGRSYVQQFSTEVDVLEGRVGWRKWAKFDRQKLHQTKDVFSVRLYAKPNRYTEALV